MSTRALVSLLLVTAMPSFAAAPLARPIDDFAAPQASDEAPAPAAKDAATRSTASRPERIMVASSADRDTTNVIAAGKKEHHAKFPFHVQVFLENSVGYATFLKGSVQRPLYDIGLTVRPSIMWDDHNRLRLTLGLTQNVVANADSQLRAEGETLLNDTILDYFYLNAWRSKSLGLAFHAGVSVVLPTSLASRTKSLLTAVRPTLVLSGHWGWFSATYQFRVSKSFYRYTHASVENVGAVPICINRDQLVAGRCFPGGFANVEWSFLNAIALNAQVWKGLYFGVSYAILNALTYDVGPSDEFTSSNAKAGRGRRDLTSAEITAGYDITKHVSVELAVATLQQPKTPDNKSFRFPFFTANADNLTSFVLRAVGTF